MRLTFVKSDYGTVKIKDVRFFTLNSTIHNEHFYMVTFNDGSHTFYPFKDWELICVHS